MGTFKKEEAKKADKALVEAPASVVDARTKIIANLSLVDEMLREPAENNFANAPGRALVHPGSNTGSLEATLSQQCERLAKFNCALMGYDTESFLKYSFGVIEDYEESVNLAMSDTNSLAVVIVNLDGDTEVTMSNELGSTFTIGSNTFSNYIGDYYIVQDYDTNEILNLDDDVGVFVAPSPYIPQNVINGDPVIKPEDGDVDAPTSASDTRFDFRISNTGITVTDIYIPQLIHNIKLNSVSNDVSFVAGETLLSGDVTMLLDSVSTVNTVTMSADLIGISRIERGNTGFETSDQVQGLSSGAFGSLSTLETAFRWSLETSGAELTDDLISTIEGYDQGVHSQLYGTMNLVSYTLPNDIVSENNGDDPVEDALFPARIFMHHDIKLGVSNNRSGELVVGADANTQVLGPPALGKTVPLRRWRDHDDDNPAHSTGLLAIISARGLQMNYDWFTANNRHEGGLDVDDVTKLNNTLFTPHLGWGTNTDVGIVKASRRTDFRSSTSNNGTQNAQFHDELGTDRPDDHYNKLEDNPFYPASVDDMPDKSSPYAGIYAHWDDAYNNGAGAVAFAHYSELRWRYQPNPFLLDYDRNNSDNEVKTSITIPGYTDGNQNTSLEEVKDLRAPDPLYAGIQRLINNQYDGYSSNTGTFRFNLDGDVPGPTYSVLTDWENPGTNSFSVPAWTRTTGSQFPWGSDSTPTANDSYLPFPLPSAGFSSYGGVVSNQANTLTPAYPFAAPSEYEPGIYYIRQQNSNGYKIYKVTGTYVQNTTLHVVNNFGFYTNTLYYNHHIVFDSEELDNEIGLYSRLFHSNDWRALTTTMANRMYNVYGGNYSTMPDGHWELYFGTDANKQDINYPSFNFGNTAGDSTLDVDTATYRCINDHLSVLNEFEMAFTNFFNGLTNTHANKNGLTLEFPYDTNVLLDALKIIRDQMVQWKVSFANRIGHPVGNSAQGTSASGYSKELYTICDLLINDDVGPLTKAGNAIKNLDGVYDDIVSNRVKYKTFAT